MLITVHRWFANKSCPGEWLYSRLGDLANKVNTILQSPTTDKKEEEDETMTQEKFNEMMNVCLINRQKSSPRLGLLMPEAGLKIKRSFPAIRKEI